MAEKTNISWSDATFNPFIGCTKISPACTNCYAERDMDKRLKRVVWGPKGTRSKTSEENWGKPKKWNEKAGAEGRRMRVFCASLSDVFEDWTGPIVDHCGRQLFTINGSEYFTEAEYPDCRPATMDDIRRKLFDLIDETPHLDWLLLSKRPENIRRMWPFVSNDVFDWNMNPKNVPDNHLGIDGGVRHDMYRHNVWLGTTVENQAEADKRIPELLRCRDLSPVLFLSMEPLLGPVDLNHIRVKKSDTPHLGKPDVTFSALRGWYGAGADERARIDWCITGGESGPNARPTHPDWLRSLRDQCEAAGVPWHFKQWGQWRPERLADDRDLLDARKEVIIRLDGSTTSGLMDCDASDYVMARVGKKTAGRLLDGVEHNGFPSTDADHRLHSG